MLFRSAAINQNSISTQRGFKLNSRVVGKAVERNFIIKREVVFNGLEGQSAIHGAALEVDVAKLACQARSDRTFSCTGGTVNGNDQFARGRFVHLRVRLYMGALGDAADALRSKYLSLDY